MISGLWGVRAVSYSCCTGMAFNGVAYRPLLEAHLMLLPLLQPTMFGRWVRNSQYALILHWDGDQWVEVPGPVAGDLNRLEGISALAPDDIWAVGSYRNGELDQNSSSPLGRH